MSIDRTHSIKDMLMKYMTEQVWREAFLDDLSKGEDENPFSNLCAVIRRDKITLTPEDKKLIDEIGESLWTAGPYWQHRMKTKYWKDIVEEEAEKEVEAGKTEG